MRALFNRGRIWFLTMVSGGGLLVLQGCDQSVRDTVLQGVGAAATSLSATFIQAFIESLSQEEETATTVKAIIEAVPQFFA